MAYEAEDLMKKELYSSLKESLLLFHDLTFKSLSETLYNHLNNFYGYNECKNVNVKWKKGYKIINTS